LRTVCEAYEKQEDHDAAVADCTEAIKIDPKYGWPTTTVASRITVCMNTMQRWPTTPRRSGSIPGRVAYTRRGMAWTEKGEFDQAVANITEAVTIDRNTLGFGQRGQALFRKRLITKKRGMGARDRRLQRASSSIQNGLAVSARGVALQQNNRQYDLAVPDCSEPSSASLKIPADTIASASLTKAEGL